MLDVTRLRVLREVAEQGSFSAAADALNFTQSAVSQQIAALERETGTKLLQRGNGGVRLTDAGHGARAHTDGDPRPARRRGARAGGDRGPARRPGAAGELPERGRDARDRGRLDVPRALPRGGAEPRRGRAHDTVPRLKRGEFDVAVVCDYTHGTGGGQLLEGLDRIHLLDDPLVVAVPEATRLPRARGCGWSRSRRSPGWPGAVAASATA